MPLISAATVMLMHPQASGPQFLLVRRNPVLPVQGNVWVFPGGRLAAIDSQNAVNGNALRACAVRETQEEAGVALDPAALIRMVRWVTPEGIPKRFDTRFFLAYGVDRPSVQVDGHEIIDHRWLTAAEALQQHRQGQILLSPPGFVLLTWMVTLGSVEEILAYFRQAPTPHFKPRLIQLPDGGCNLYAEDAAYQTGNLDQPGPRHRLWMREAGWRYEGNPLA